MSDNQSVFAFEKENNSLSQHVAQSISYLYIGTGRPSESKGLLLTWLFSHRKQKKSSWKHTRCPIQFLFIYLSVYDGKVPPKAGSSAALVLYEPGSRTLLTGGSIWTFPFLTPSMPLENLHNVTISYNSSANMLS